MHVSDQMLEESGATLQDVEGFIDFPRSLRSVKVAVLIKESSDGVCCCQSSCERDSVMWQKLPSCLRVVDIGMLLDFAAREKQ